MKAVFLDFGTMGAEDLDPSTLAAVVPELEVFDSTPAERVAERIDGVAFVFANKVRMTADLIASASALRFIGLTATGVDNVDLEAAKKHDIAVCNIRSYCTQSVVEHVFAVLLNLTHSIQQYDRSARSGAWQRADNFCMLEFPIRELSAMTIGIVGHGNLGSGVAAIARQFGMTVMLARRPGTLAEADDGRFDLQEVLAKSDVISLHCPLTDDTRGLLGAAEFRRMKPGAILINTARGGLVDSTALVEALRSGTIAAAAIDVLPNEPPVDGNPLLAYRGDNLLVTPHIAWGTVEARQRAIDEVAANAQAFLAGERRNRVV
jgi:glycerate dehydrogenase